MKYKLLSAAPWLLSLCLVGAVYWAYRTRVEWGQARDTLEQLKPLSTGLWLICTNRVGQPIRVQFPMDARAQEFITNTMGYRFPE